MLGFRKGNTIEKFPALTGVRAIAAYLVFVHHYADTPEVSGPLYPFFAQGHVGVSVFYVLSGFLITYNYAPRFGVDAGFWLRYAGRRFGRIFPLYWALLAVTYFGSTAPLPSASSVILNVTLLKGFFDDFKFDGVAPSWSLTVEETFYFLAPVLFTLVRRIGAVGVQLSLYVVGALLLLAGHQLGFHGLFGNFRFVALYTFFGRSFEFAVGMALARTMRNLPGLLAKPSRLKFTYLGAAGIVLVMYWLALLGGPTGPGLFKPGGIVLNDLVLPTFIGMFLMGLTSESTCLRSMLSSRPFIFLGRASYAFYLVHMSVISGFISSHLHGLGSRSGTVVLFVACNLVAGALYLFVELPANRKVRTWTEKIVRLRFATKSRWPTFQLVRGLAVTWLLLLTLGFCAWGWSAFGASNFVDFLELSPKVASEARISIPQFRHPESAKTDFGIITSKQGVVDRLTYVVGGKDIAPLPFIFAHAKSRIVYTLPSGKWSSFEFSTGLDDAGGDDGGSVEYVVVGDGRVLFRSTTIHALEPPCRHEVVIKGVRQLELIVTDAGNGLTSDEAYWIAPMLR